MADLIRQALESLLDAEPHIYVTGPEYEQARDAARTALAAEPPAPAPAASFAARLRQCPAHGQLPANAWACPECLRELREELTRLRAPAAADPSGVQSADGEVEELAQWLEQLMLAFHREDDSTDASHCLRAAALLRQPAPAPTLETFSSQLAHNAYIAFVQICKGNSDDAGTYEKDEELVRVALSKLDQMERQPAPAPVPVFVVERPWERPGWCDAEGRCWWLVPNQSWPCLYLMKADSALAAPVATHCLPHWAIAIPQPPQGVEVEQ